MLGVIGTCWGGVDWRHAVNVFGLELNVVGILIAMWGVESLGMELQTKSWTPLHTIRDAAGTARRRLTFWRRGTEVRPVTLQAKVTMGGAAIGTITRGLPPQATLEQQIEVLRLQISDLNNRIDTSNSRIDALGGRVDEVRVAAEAGDRALRDEIKRIIGGGLNGEGLKEAWIGLAITLVGTVLQGLA